MTKVFISIGSNIDKEKNIVKGLNSLSSHFGKLTISPIYECAAYGFEGADFFNLVSGFTTEKEIDEVLRILKNIEQSAKRLDSGSQSYKSRTLDIDLLLYGNTVNAHYRVPREDIKKFNFVLKPLADLAPNEVHPVTGETFAELWRTSNINTPSLHLVNQSSIKNTSGYR